MTLPLFAPAPAAVRRGTCASGPYLACARVARVPSCPVAGVYGRAEPSGDRWRVTVAAHRPGASWDAVEVVATEDEARAVLERLAGRGWAFVGLDSAGGAG